MRSLPIVPAIALALVLVVAGCAAPVGPASEAPSDTTVPTVSGTNADGDGDSSSPGAEGESDAETSGTDATNGTDATAGPSEGSPEGTESTGSPTPRPDPASDRRGWEGGYWHDDPVAVTPGDGLDGSELDAVVARAMARVELIRGIEFDRDVPVRVLSRDEYRAERASSGDGSGADRERRDARTIDSGRYRALFLVGDRENATRREQETRSQSILGYYDVGEDRIVIVSDAETPTLDEVTLAQELAHAYQFRSLDLRLPRNPTDDEVRALVALIEGDANLVDRLYEKRCEGAWECVGSTETGTGAGDARDAGTGGDTGTDDTGTDDTADRKPDSNASGVHMGLYLLEYFPYAEGESLVRDARADGGWDAVAHLYENPPRSSEQVIHPEKIGRDSPERVDVPDRSRGDWRRVTRPDGGSTATVGEAGIATMFMYGAYDDRPGAVVPRSAFLNVEDGRVNETDPVDYALNYSTGWAGDALAVYDRPDGSIGYVWRIRWDDPDEAREFVDGYRALLSYHDGTDRGAYWRLDDDFGGAYAVRVDGRTVTIVHAPTADGLDAVWPGATKS